MTTEPTIDPPHVATAVPVRAGFLRAALNALPVSERVANLVNFLSGGILFSMRKRGWISLLVCISAIMIFGYLPMPPGISSDLHNLTSGVLGSKSSTRKSAQTTWWASKPLPKIVRERVVCSNLERNYLEMGYMSHDMRLTYCEEVCTFAPILCVATVEINPLGTVGLQLLDGITHQAYGSVASFFEGETELSLDFSIDDGTRDTWLELGVSFSPLLLGVIPILLNQYKFYNYWTAVISIAGFIVLQLGGSVRPMMTFHNCAIATLCLVHPAGSSALVEVSQGFVPLMMLVFAIFIPNPVFQMCVLVFTITLFFFFNYWLFFSKKKTHMIVLQGIMQILVLWEQLTYVRQTFAETTIVGAGIELFVRAFLPSGKSSFCFVNIINFAKHVAQKLPLVSNWKLYSFVVLVFSQVIMFIGFRAAFGQYSMMILRFKTGPQYMWDGLMIYMCDFWGPIKCATRLILGFETVNRRRVAYAAVALCIMVHELQCAAEFLFIRFVMSSVDLLFLDSGRAKATKYLGESLDMKLQAFPQDKSYPWFSLDGLIIISKFVTEVVAVKDRSVKGIGLLLSVAGKNKLFTVNHVVDGAKTLEFMGHTVVEPSYHKLTTGDDPVVMVDVPDTDFDPPECPVLLRAEASFVANMFFVNTSLGEAFVTFIPPSCYTLRNSELSACVDLKHGDSGGPVFAVLKNGETRFCGAVSKGVRNRGAGNIIAFVYGDEEIGVDSDTGEEITEVRNYNRARRVTFASEQSEEGREKDYHGLIRFLKRYFNDLNDGFERFGSVQLDPDDFSVGDKDFEIYIEETYPLDNAPPKDDSADSDSKSDHGGVPGRRRRRKNVNKDRAAWKHRVTTCECLWARLTKIYCETDSRKIYDAIVLSNNWPKLDKPRFIALTDGSGWIYVDDLPARDWH